MTKMKWLDTNGGAVQTTNKNLNVQAARFFLSPALALAFFLCGASHAATVTVTEFYHSGLKHYFTTADPIEASGIDKGAAGAGWVRTGLSFTAWPSLADAPLGATPVCRFYGTPGVGPNSHFYTAESAECSGVKKDPGWFYEGIAFYSLLPQGGSCALGYSPVYRNYNNRAASNDSNHRFTTDNAVYQSMVSAGWVAEGVAMCTPSSTAWTKYVGAHYTNTPGSGLTRTWAGGGLRDPGGNGTSYQPTLSGGNYVDGGYAAFTSIALPSINTLLGDGKHVVQKIGGLVPATASVFLDSMATLAGRNAYKKSISDRIDQIAALSNSKGWEKKIYFQFGNEINNANSTGFYGAVCLWITRNNPTPVANCDLTTQFIPTYVEYYLAPGIAHLEEKSQTLFGRPDALHVMSGSMVNLSKSESLVDGLLNYRIVGTYAPAYANRYVNSVVDTVSIHYTVTAPTWRADLDKFRNKYLPGGVPTTRVRALWATEEGGVRSAEQGYGMATALRGIARYSSWWQANNLSPDDAHVFFWGTDVNNPSDGTCTGCTSMDQDMPIFYNFVGDNALTELTQDESTFGVSGSFESYEFAVGGQDKRALIGFGPSNDGTATLSSLTLNLAPWTGKMVSVSAYRFANQGPQALTVIPASVVASPSVSVSVSTTLSGADAVLFLVKVQ